MACVFVPASQVTKAILLTVDQSVWSALTVVNSLLVSIRSVWILAQELVETMPGVKSPITMPYVSVLQDSQEIPSATVSEFR